MQGSNVKYKAKCFISGSLALWISAGALVACAPDVATISTPPNVAKSNDESKLLDLSLSPRDAVEWEELAQVASDTSGVGVAASGANEKLPDLFEENKDKKIKNGTLSVNAKPHLKLGAAPTDIPFVDGGSVSLELKTK